MNMEWSGDLIMAKYIKTEEGYKTINEIYNSEDALELAIEMGLVDPISDENNVIFTNENNLIYTL